MTKVIGKREVLRVLDSVVKAEGKSREAICYYTQGTCDDVTDEWFANGSGGLIPAEDALAPECIVGQVAARLGADMTKLAGSTDTWEAIVKNGWADGLFTDVHLTEGANALLAVAQNVQDGRKECLRNYGITSWPSGNTWGEALQVAKDNYKSINKVAKRSY